MKRFLLWLWHFFVDPPPRKPRMPKLSDGYLGPRAFQQQMREEIERRKDKG